jgi:hypothetical protein
LSGWDTTGLLAAGYALFLALVAVALEMLARHSHHRTRKTAVQGFRYHPQLDMWQCPNEKFLFRAEATPESTTVRYRAHAHQCNSCPIKDRCTDSDQGRVIEVQPDSWMQSELRKFHRGVSLTLLVLADFILVVALTRDRQGPESWLLMGLVLCVSWAGIRSAATMAHQPN